MKLIIPMAGLGKRMRPHTLATPKPLLKVAGVSIVERIIQDFASNSGKEVEEIHYIIGEFGTKVEEMLKNIADGVGAKAVMHHQIEALGTAHAVYCAESALRGEVCIAFADTLYIGNIHIEDSDEAIIWTYRVDNPESYGVVMAGKNDVITDFLEKPKEKVSDRAIVGMYYFKDGENLKAHLKRLLDEDRRVKGEFQLTDTLKDMLRQGVKFQAKDLKEWLDFGSKSNFLESVGKFLKMNHHTPEGSYETCKIFPPVFIGKNVKLVDTTVGPNVVIEDGTSVIQSEIKNTVVGENSSILRSNISNSLVGSNTSVSGYVGVLNLGDYNEIEA